MWDLPSGAPFLWDSHAFTLRITRCRGTPCRDVGHHPTRGRLPHRPATDHTVTPALDAIRRIVRALRLSARRAERDLGLSGAQLFVLQQLGERAAESVNDLAERTHTHQSSVSVVVRRLVDRNLVVRAPSREDARRVRLELSRKGRALLRRSRPAVQLSLIRAMARLSPAQRRRLGSLLRLLVKEMGLAGSPASMMFTGSEGPDGPTRHRTPHARR